MSLTALVFTGSDPIAEGTGTWTAAQDFESQVTWQEQVGGNLSTKDIFQAGVYFGVGSFSNQGLIAVEGKAIEYVKTYSSHNYPQSASTANLSLLMSHTGIASEISPFKSEVSAAASIHKPLVFGETNSGIVVSLP